LREQVMGFLITGDSLIEEAQARHVEITYNDVEKRFERVKTNEFDNSDSKLERYRELTGETLADELFRAHVKVAAEKIEEKITRDEGVPLKQRERKLVEFSNGVPVKWVGKTSCRAGYVVPNCKQYRGRAHPRMIL
jgi:hypothetical protein